MIMQISMGQMLEKFALHETKPLRKGEASTSKHSFSLENKVSLQEEF